MKLVNENQIKPLKTITSEEFYSLIKSNSVETVTPTKVGKGFTELYLETHDNECCQELYKVKVLD